LSLRANSRIETIAGLVSLRSCEG